MTQPPWGMEDIPDRDQLGRPLYHFVPGQIRPNCPHPTGPHHHMAQPLNQSPRRIYGDGSPPRPPSGLATNAHDLNVIVHGNGQRQMLPPSPSTYYPRFPPHTAISNGVPPQNIVRDPPLPPPPPPQHRPSSSMSISSMLGSESDRPPRDQSSGMASNSSSYHPKPSHPFSEMSPPQPSVKPSPGEYSYKPRSQTPDRMGISNLIGTRPYRSGSGSIMQGSRPFEDTAKPPSRATFPRVGEPIQQSLNQEHMRRTEEAFNHARRTSLSGILQRPSSQPQPPAQSNQPGQRLQPINQSQPNRPVWPENSIIQSSVVTKNSPPPAGGGNRAHDFGTDHKNEASNPAPAPPTQYDIRPPALGVSAHQRPLNTKDRDIQPSPSSWDQTSSTSTSTSPTSRRQMMGQNQYKPFGGLLNGQPSVPNPQNNQESQRPNSVPMSQHDSSQSHGERSLFGDRLDKSRSRLFSPFAGSHTSQTGQSASGAPEEQSRKGSDELSQHRALLGLAAEGKKGGRYSPLPQAVQGAQAQSIGPEMGIKSEHGRIFSGLGGGMGAASPSPALAPAGLTASPFKRDDNGPRLLNEDNLMKMSRSTSGFGKRARKVKDEEGKAASENDGNGSRVAKKARNHHHHYRLENGDLASAFDLHRRSTPLSSLNPIRRTSTPGNHNNHNSTHHHHHRPHHHHHHHHQPAPAQKIFKPTTMIKISPVVNAAAKNSRHHLGFFLYSPKIAVPDHHTPVRSKVNVSIRPNMIPSFKDPLQVNCTYTIRVSRTWLGHLERETICAERFLWGSGIYTDDSDPLAAAIHSGFVKGAWSDAVDTNLLEQVIRDQNPSIDVRDNVPECPIEPPTSKDLHITLLVLPQLEKYAESVRFGVRSRTWPEEAREAPHDGVSFMVWDCEWVDEGSARGQGRSGVARRRRLQALMVQRPVDGDVDDGGGDGGGPAAGTAAVAAAAGSF